MMLKFFLRTTLDAINWAKPIKTTSGHVYKGLMRNKKHGQA